MTTLDIPIWVVVLVVGWPFIPGFVVSFVLAYSAPHLVADRGERAPRTTPARLVVYLLCGLVGGILAVLLQVW